MKQEGLIEKMKQYSVFLTNNKVIEWSNSRLLVVVSRAPVSENTRFALFTGRLAERVEEGETSLSELWSISTNDLSIKKKNSLRQSVTMETNCETNKWGNIGQRTWYR